MLTVLRISLKTRNVSYALTMALLKGTYSVSMHRGAESALGSPELLIGTMSGAQ